MRAFALSAMENVLQILRLLVCVLWISCLVPLSGRAAIVADLYSAQVPVDDRGTAALTDAAQAALSQVLVKVSGSEGVLQSPEVISAMGSARNRVLTYAYVEQPGEAAQPEVRFEFDADYVTDLVRRSGAPLWTANRPPVLAWVVVQEDNRQRFLSEESDAELADAIKEAFSRRGLILQLPLHDLKDAAAVRASDAWSRNRTTLREASRRYAVADIAIARFTAAADGEYAADWVYWSADDAVTAPSRRGQPEGVVQLGADLIADTMAARYAVSPSSGEVIAVRMLVSGVFEYGDYAGIVRWLRSLEPISYANLERVQGDRLTLVMGTRAQPSSLRRIIELNERLVPEQTRDPYVPLSYRWQN